MRTLGVFGLLLASMAGCATPTEEQVMTGPGNMTPYVEKEFVAGPKLVPASELLKWLDAKKGTTLLRVPVTIERGEYGEHLGAKLGELEVRLNDTALGVSLADRVRRACPGHATCRVWLEGRWANEGEFRVVHLSRAVRPDEAADFVELER